MGKPPGLFCWPPSLPLGASEPAEGTQQHAVRVLMERHLDCLMMLRLNMVDVATWNVFWWARVLVKCCWPSLLPLDASLLLLGAF
jgi:hypothetical protein